MQYRTTLETSTKPVVPKAVMKTDELCKALQCLGVDMETHDRPVSSSFLPGVWLDDGKVHVCPWSAQPGDMLHECGHWAIIPSRFRGLVTPDTVECDTFTDAAKAYVRSEESYENGVDHWLTRALINGGEMEAQAWSFSAAYRVGMDPMDVFNFRYEGVPDERQPYGGEGDDVFSSLVHGQHAGVNGLQAAGMCTVRDWPNMIRWVQP